MVQWPNDAVAQWGSGSHQDKVMFMGDDSLVTVNTVLFTVTSESAAVACSWTNY